MSSRARIILASGCITYLSLGIAGTTLGPLLPELAGRTGIALSGAGLILSFYYLGGILSRLLAGMLSDRFGAVPVVFGGLIVEACSGLALTLSRSQAVLYASSFMLGVALGSGLLGAVLIAAKLTPDRSVALVNLVNVFWGIGSFVGPALFSAVSASVHNGLPVIWISGGIALVALPFLLSGGRQRDPTLEVHNAGSSSDPAPQGVASSWTGLLGTPVFWLFGSILLFEVGTESILGGWAAVYLHLSVPVDLQVAALVVSGFYICFSAGRMITATIGSRVGASWVLSSALLFALGGMVLVSAVPGRLTLSIVGFLLAGLGIGPIYPTITALVSRRFGARAGTAIGLTGSIGFVGGVLFPWLAGTLMPILGAVASMRLTVVLIIVVAFLSFLTSRYERVRRAVAGQIPRQNQ